MRARNDNTPIVIPRPPTSIGGVFSFCAGVAKALTALRDRRAIYTVPRNNYGQALPFEVSSNSGELRAQAGVFCEEPYSMTTEETPADGDWSFVGVLTIDADTGAVVSTNMEWRNSAYSDTSTTFYCDIGYAYVNGGVVETIEQYNYGPIVGVIHGGIADRWGVYFV